MKIEKAHLRTLDAVTALLRSQFDEHGIRLGGPELSNAVRVLVTEPERGAVLIASDPAPIGLAVLAYTWTLEHGGQVAWLDELFVSPEHRGRGVGRALLLRALEVASEDGCKAVDLEVDAEHARAEHLYEREGFSPLARRRWVRRL